MGITIVKDGKEIEVTSVADLIAIRSYPKEKVPIGGVPIEVSAMSEDEVEIFVREMDALIHGIEHETIKAIVLSNVDLIFDVVRYVNANTKQGFKGAYARGQALTILWIQPSDFNKTTWLKTYSSTGWTDWAFSESSPDTVAEEEAFIILGWYNPIDVPKVSQVQLIKNGDKYVPETLSLTFRTKSDAYGAHQNREPWVLGPESTYAIRSYATATGDDKLTPIGFKIARASDVIS